jgi:hypothetical protein
VVIDQSADDLPQTGIFAGGSGAGTRAVHDAHDAPKGCRRPLPMVPSR